MQERNRTYFETMRRNQAMSYEAYCAHFTSSMNTAMAMAQALCALSQLVVVTVIVGVLIT